jgi:hypothetical protein
MSEVVGRYSLVPEPAPILITPQGELQVNEAWITHDSERLPNLIRLIRGAREEVLLVTALSEIELFSREKIDLIKRKLRQNVKFDIIHQARQVDHYSEVAQLVRWSADYFNVTPTKGKELLEEFAVVDRAIVVENQRPGLTVVRREENGAIKSHIERFQRLKKEFLGQR